MFKFRMFQKHSIIFSIMSLILTHFSAVEAADRQNPPHCPRKCGSDLTGFYLGGFGGWGFNSFYVTQKGIAFYLSEAGGPLVVDSDGTTDTNKFGFGGGHIGYEWLNRTNSSWSFTPGIELEGYYFSNTTTVMLENPTERLDFHEFLDTFPTRNGIVIADFTLGLTNNYITPYIGLGVGASITSINNAVATQTEFPEPGINHFNSNPDAFNWGFASQLKGGLRYSLFKYMRIFGEYRFLFVAANDYTFGHTVSPGHVATADWLVRFGGTYNNLFSLGIDFTW